MADDNEGRHLCSARKNGDVVVTQKSLFKGSTRVDIRLHYVNDEGEIKPTKKGVSLTMDEAREVFNGLARAFED